MPPNPRVSSELSRLRAILQGFINRIDVLINNPENTGNEAEAEQLQHKVTALNAEIEVINSSQGNIKKLFSPDYDVDDVDDVDPFADPEMEIPGPEIPGPEFPGGTGGKRRRSKKLKKKRRTRKASKRNKKSVYKSKRRR